MTDQTIRDLFWLWGMKTNVLQEMSDFFAAFGKSSMTVEQAMQKTGTRNVIMAGGMPISRESLDAMPSARRIICKSSIHEWKRSDGGGDMDGGAALDPERGLSGLTAAKALAAADTRIEGYLLDDFSTGAIEAGGRPEHLARLQLANITRPPHLPLSGTIYTMTLDRPELPALLPHFGQLLVPLWHADQIDTVPSVLDGLSEMSGGKPMLLCLYLFDFGNRKPITRELMQRHLDLAEELLLATRVAGLVICGTCMMDLDWESNHCLYEWLDRVGDRTIPDQ